jgi:hypothetical protein
MFQSTDLGEVASNINKPQSQFVFKISPIILYRDNAAQTAYVNAFKCPF